MTSNKTKKSNDFKTKERSQRTINKRQKSKDYKQKKEGTLNKRQKSKDFKQKTEASQSTAHLRWVDHSSEVFDAKHPKVGDGKCAPLSEENKPDSTDPTTHNAATCQRGNHKLDSTEHTAHKQDSTEHTAHKTNTNRIVLNTQHTKPTQTG